MSSTYRILWLLVEGADDRRFCRDILIPVFQPTFDHVDIWDYSEEQNSRLTRLLQSVDSMNADYLLFGDIDDRPCVTATKEYITRGIPRLEWDRIVVVRREIEAWYLAGLDEAAHRELGLARVRNIDEVAKEHFDRLVGGEDEHTNTMVEILRHYDVEVARQRSPSFGYFWQKHVE